MIVLIAVQFSARVLAASEVTPEPVRIPERELNVLQFGAVGDGSTLNTLAFSKAVAAIAAGGGGRLVVPSGVFVTQPFSLASQMELHLEKGAVIQFSTDLHAYGLSVQPTLDQMKKLKERYPALMTGNDLSDVAITGDGIIDGGGGAWWNLTAVDRSGEKHTEGSSRPKLIVLTNVHRVKIEGVTLRNSPRYHLMLRQCEDVIVDGVHVISPGDSPNTDGIDPIACKTMVIRNCDLDVGDDNIAIKAIDGPAANILVENCRCEHGRGISIGSETYGGIHDITVRHCTFDGTVHGIHIKSARDRGNQLFGFEFSDIAMKDVAEPLIINLYYLDRQGAKVRVGEPVTASTPFVHDVQITGLVATGAAAAGEIIGLPESPVKQVTLTNVNISAQTGMVVTDAAGVVFQKVTIDVKTGEPLISDHADVSWDR